MSEIEVVGLSDLHMGSNVSVKPDNVYIGQQDEQLRIPTGMSNLNDFMNRKWRLMEKKHGSADVVLLYGDNTDGTDSISEGYGCWTTDMDIQIDVAHDLLKETFPNAVFYGVQGSKYHSKMNPSADKRLLAKLNGVGANRSEIGEFFGDDKKISIGGINFYMRHVMGYSRKKELRSGAILREMVSAELNQPFYGKFHYVTFGHCHYWIYVENNFNAGMCMPGWKGRDSFVKHRGMDVPDCGCITFYIEKGLCRMEKDVWQLPTEMLISTSVYKPKESKESVINPNYKNVLKRMFIN